jgi:hypothetical protein
MGSLFLVLFEYRVDIIDRALRIQIISRTLKLDPEFNNLHLSSETVMPSISPCVNLAERWSIGARLIGCEAQQLRGRPLMNVDAGPTNARPIIVAPLLVIFEEDSAFRGYAQFL